MYTKEQIAAAKNVNLIELLEGMNYPLKRITDREYALLAHDSLKISPTGMWYWHSRGVGGKAIDFFMVVEGMSFIEAMDTIIKQPAYKGEKTELPAEKEKKVLKLPIANLNNERVIKYLTEVRGIDKNIIMRCIKDKKIYEASKTHNAVFVGYDSNGMAQYASVRGTTAKKFAGDVAGSSKSFGFFMGNRSSSTLHLFESPIDLLSFMTLEHMAGRKCNEAYLALSGVSTKAFQNYIRSNDVRLVYVRTDSDDAGKGVYEKLLREYNGEKITVLPAFPDNKDYNDDLLEYIKKQGGKGNE